MSEKTPVAGREPVAGETARTPDRPSGPTRLRRVARTPALPWALFALAAAAAVTFAFLWRAAASDEPGAEVRDAARRFLTVLTNFSADTIDRDVEEIRGFAVGDFAQEVDQTFSQQQIGAIRENEVVSTGRVRSVFVQTLEGSTATAFGVVHETVLNDSLPAPRAEVLRVELELIETPEGWKVSSVQILQSPGAAPFG